VKCSICFTLLRLADRKKRFCYILYAIMALSIIAGIVTIIGVLNACKPLRAFWGEVEGTCNADISVAIGLYLSATCIATDFVLAVLPAVMLWDVQIKRRVKIYIVAILALGALASVSTIVRIPYLLRYSEPDRILKTAAPLSCWTVGEVAIGICAGPIAQLRPLLRYVPFIKHSSYDGHTSDHPSRTLRSRSGIVKLTTLHAEGKNNSGTASTRRIHGRDELDILDTDSDMDSQEERLNGTTHSMASETTAFPDDVESAVMGTIRKDTEVTVQPWSPSRAHDAQSVASSEAGPVAVPLSPDFTFRDGGTCKTEVWHRRSRG
jgi:hypothetical protein